ncbi:MAG TPA: acyl-CoA dehydrogenase family protein [Acidimicrobiales bacterium]|nr:acyl-CoA dehydrogenase family protein [Acidimicrobiales bacterium]
MDPQLSEDERLLTDSARRSFERYCPITLVRALREPGTSGHSPELWSTMAAQGWLGLGLPEAHGGAGSLVDLGLVAEEAGRALVPTTFRSTVQAAQLVALLGTAAQQGDLLARVAAGSLLATVAELEPQALHDPRYLRTVATPSGDGWVLSGAKAFVANAGTADLMLVVARVADGAAGPVLGVFCVPAGADGLSVSPHATFAHDRQARVVLDHVHVTAEAALGGPLGPGAATAAALADARARWVALLCAEMAGGAQKVLELTADYVTGRVQFGRPIGSFQAVQHHVADMATRADGARLATHQALWRLAHGRPAAREVAVAKAWTGEAYKAITVMAHQLHGGMGYVRENDLHLWSEHAKAAELSLGARDHHLFAVAAELGLSPATL